jgi:hypothetical protein
MVSTGFGKKGQLLLTGRQEDGEFFEDSRIQGLKDSRDLVLTNSKYTSSG